MRILFIGDIMGEPGRKAIFRNLDRLRDQHNIDFVIGNSENAAGGFGITEPIAKELYDMGLDVLTLGNHAWDKREAVDYIRTEKRLLRPANYPDGTPGVGSGLYVAPSGQKIGVVQVMGRVFMQPLDCPFRAATREVAKLKQQTPIVFVDMHAEATSEKVAMGWHLDGQASAVVGSHSHVQTGDERILPEGTGYLTDAGMTGPRDGIIGMKRELVLSRFLTNMPRRFAVASGPVLFCGAMVDIDAKSGKCTHIERIRCGDD